MIAQRKQWLKGHLEDWTGNVTEEWEVSLEVMQGPANHIKESGQSCGWCSH